MSPSVQPTLAGGDRSGTAPPAASIRSRFGGLRGRAALVFFAVALVLSSAVAITVWFTVSNYLLNLRQKAATIQTASHVDQLVQTLPQEGSSSAQLLAQLPREVGSSSLLAIDGQWVSSSLESDRGDLPTALRDAVLAGKPSYQRFEIDGEPMLAMGVPLPSEVGGAYFEIFLLSELDKTFQLISAVLIAGVVVIPVGSYVLGWWALRPALRPLDRVAAAAAAIAGGDLSARLNPDGDPWLESLATSFNDTATALERRVRADAKFAADVSHELRSPLTTMMNAMSLVDSHRAGLSSPAQEALDLLSTEVGRFSRLVEDLLEISRSDAGSADVVLQRVSLAGLVRESVPPRLLDRVVVHPAAADAIVCVDKRRMQQVVMNLIDNAERHGGGLVGLTVETAEGIACLSIDDAGPGLQEEERERIFERFSRGRRIGRDSTHGAGLGLSLVARHLRLMGGTVTALNREEGGARFVVTLPTDEVTTCAD